MVRNLIVVNAVVFLITDLMGLQTLKFMGLLHPFNTEAFLPVQLFTHMFLHADFMHLFFNMLIFFFFGPMLEQFWGSNRFLMFYTICGIGAAGLYAFISYFQSSLYPMLGASGAIYGVMMGTAMIFPNTEMRLLFLPFTFKVKHFVMFWGLLALYQALNAPGDGVAHLAHLSGILFGFILIKVWQSS